MNFSTSVYNLVSVVNMSAYHLRKNEIEYELRIRGQPTEGNAGELRKRYTQCLASNTQVDEDVISKLDPGNELEQVEEKFDDLSTLVNDYEGERGDNEYQRILARLWHLYLRITRIPVGEDSEEEEQEKKKELAVKSKQMLDLFEVGQAGTSNKEEKVDTSITEDTKRSVNVEEDNAAPPKVIRPSSIKESASKEANVPPVLSSKIFPSCPTTSVLRKNMKSSTKFEEPQSQFRQKLIPVYKWGLRFDGQSDQSVGSFLERVEELRRARGVSHDELFESAVDLFSGPALVWYRSTLTRIISWEELCQEMKIVFQSPDYDFRLRQEISNRLQGEQEQIDLYIAAMEGLYARLSETVSEATKLSQIYNNLHPYLQDRLALFEIRSLEELRFMGRRAEAGRLRSNTPREQPRNNYTMEPEFAYVDPRRRRGPPMGKVASLRTTSSSGSNSAKCWNCGMAGHTYSSCRKERNKFCFGCGKPDTIKSSCTHCRPKNEQVAGTS